MEKQKKIKINLSTIIIIIAFCTIVLLSIILINSLKNNNSISNESIGMNSKNENVNTNLINNNYNYNNTANNSISINNDAKNNESVEEDQEENNIDTNTTYSNDSNNNNISNNITEPVNENIVLEGKYYLPNSDNYYIFNSNGNVTFYSEDLTIEGEYKIKDNSKILFSETRRTWKDPETGEVSEEEREDGEVTYILNNENSFTVYEEGEQYTYIKE